MMSYIKLQLCKNQEIELGKFHYHKEKFPSFNPFEVILFLQPLPLLMTDAFPIIVIFSLGMLCKLNHVVFNPLRLGLLIHQNTSVIHSNYHMHQ